MKRRLTVVGEYIGIFVNIIFQKGRWVLFPVHSQQLTWFPYSSSFGTAGEKGSLHSWRSTCFAHFLILPSGSVEFALVW